MARELNIVGPVVTKLRRLDRTVPEIASEAGVPVSWLYMFRRGKISNPGVQQFERVRRYLERTAA